MNEENYPTYCQWCGNLHPPVPSAEACPPAVPANPEPVLVSCHFCKGMHEKGTEELCPLKTVTLGDTYVEALGRRYGRQWRELMYGSFLPGTLPSKLRRMDEAASTATLSLSSVIHMLNTLQSLYVEAHGTHILTPGDVLNLQGDIRVIERIHHRLAALVDAKHMEVPPCERCGMLVPTKPVSTPDGSQITLLCEACIKIVIRPSTNFQVQSEE